MKEHQSCSKPRLNKRAFAIFLCFATCLLLLCSCAAGEKRESPDPDDYGYDMAYENARSLGYYVGYMARENGEPYISDYSKYPFGYGFDDYEGVGIDDFLDGMAEGYEEGFKVGFIDGWCDCADGKPYEDNLGEGRP